MNQIPKSHLVGLALQLEIIITKISKKYPKFDNSGTEIPELYFYKFNNIIDINLTHVSL